MVIVSCGFSPCADEITAARDLFLFRATLPLLLANESAILQCAEYFYSQPAFSWCSCAFIAGGPLPIGYLILSWQNDRLIGNCPHCASKVLVTSFAGSPLTGSNWWKGFCRSCNHMKVGRFDRLVTEITFILRLRKIYPISVTKIEEFDGFMFDWDRGLKPATKTRKITVPVTEPVSFEQLIAELSNEHSTRASRMPNVTKIVDTLELKFGTLSENWPN